MTSESWSCLSGDGYGHTLYQSVIASGFSPENETELARPAPAGDGVALLGCWVAFLLVLSLVMSDRWRCPPILHGGAVHQMGQRRTLNQRVMGWPCCGCWMAFLLVLSLVVSDRCRYPPILHGVAVHQMGANGES
jgi:hypothetical protein